MKSNIGRNVRTIRKSLGMSQEELAAKAGYKNSSFIVAIENGSTEPSYEKIKDIANALNVSIYQVRGRQYVHKTTAEEKIYYSDAEVLALDMLAPMISAMSETEREKLMDFGILLLKAEGKEPKWKRFSYKNQKVEDFD